MRETMRRVFELSQAENDGRTMTVCAEGGRVVSLCQNGPRRSRSPQQARDYARALVAIADEIDPPRKEPEARTCVAKDLKVGQRYSYQYEPGLGTNEMFVRLEDRADFSGARVDLGADAHEFVPVMSLRTYRVSRCLKTFPVYPEPV